MESEIKLLVPFNYCKQPTKHIGVKDTIACTSNVTRYIYYYFM